MSGPYRFVNRRRRNWSFFYSNPTGQIIVVGLTEGVCMRPETEFGSLRIELTQIIVVISVFVYTLCYLGINCLQIRPHFISRIRA